MIGRKNHWLRNSSRLTKTQTERTVVVYGVFEIPIHRAAWDRGQLTLPSALKAQCPNRATFNCWLDSHYQKHWVVHFAKACANAERNIHYLGRYLKRPVISMNRLPRKDPDGKISFHYLDHRTKRYRRFRCTQENFLKRLLQHTPDKHFRMIRYYGLPGEPGALKVSAQGI